MNDNHLSALVRTAPAKINLALHVTGRRDDGYHLLDTLAVFADLGDALSFAPAEDFSLEVSGRFAEIVPDGADNLILRAAEALKRASGATAGAQIAVKKEIPAGAGLGGGSSDASTTLLALAELWGVGMPMDELVALGATLGADVPMGLFGGALRARGIGEEITLLPSLPALPLVLVWPARVVSTGKVFQTLGQSPGRALPELPDNMGDARAVADFLKTTTNDLEAPAVALEPAIGDVLQALSKTPCLFARMSGSGSACFAIYETLDAAGTAAETLARAHPQWWVRATLAR
ncbi:4-(cytidine 5'-diphospho)-2-C-methyl-D-erythritol kinase [Afifella marina]|uniref:4-diphosphocytidyl-2-C-methyl-D-erythritol kinase n=1 Tax=Afifella marina DSM 2698 TaxID=1120955 RepID=A0A1G5MAK0_AFIMA|nr:4-(cytidine 5'-diphospho)-2-C-methyl-D-erythritol kinase [Afifella marina]SCZ22237.1 4-diphosphocytidyl-2-C-methyl-D-erythritol kinase [Afifella marina DSM 2698]